jgi:hypothetical protein
MSRRSEYPASGSSSSEIESRTHARERAPRRTGRAPRLIAVGFMQLVSLVGIVGLAVALGAILTGSLSGWADGLVIGAVSVGLTILVLFSGRHARRH